MRVNRLGVALLVLLFTSSCAHSVRMISVPEGAVIKVDGKKIGKAPVLFHDRSGTLGRSYKIEAVLPGQGKVVRKEAVKICPTKANLILDSLWVGFLFGFCLQDEYVMDFTAKSTSTKKVRTKGKKKRVRAQKKKG